MTKKDIVAIYVAALIPAANAYAFGLGDIVSVGIQAGGELVRAAGGKAVDAIKDSMRDPEAEAREKADNERKFAERMQKQISEIEAMPNLRPIDRERLVLQLQEQYKAAKEMQAFVERAEAQQKVERDKVLTAGGFAGVLGRAALNTPSVAVARADAMARDPAYRAQLRTQNEAVFRQADAMVAAGVPQAKAQAVLAQADAAMKVGTTPTVLDAAQAGASTGPAGKDSVIPLASGSQIAVPSSPHPDDKGADVAKAGASVEMQPREPSVQPASLDAFSPDLGKKLWIEFEDAPTETVLLRKLLQERGHTLAQTKDDAEVAYFIQGEFIVPETKMHDGLKKSAGALLENPGQAVEPPAKKTMGAISAGISQFMLGAAGVKAPTTQTNGFRQQVLLVIARQPNDGKETRASIVQKAQGQDIEAAKLAKGAREELYRLLGV